MFKLKLTKFRRSEKTRSQHGFTLIEVVIAIMLLGLVAAALFNGLGTASNVRLRNDIRQTTKNLAESQMESVKNQLFVPGVTSYATAPIPAAQAGFYEASITVASVAGRDNKLQKITVYIKNKTTHVILYKLEGYKVQ